MNKSLAYQLSWVALLGTALAMLLLCALAHGSTLADRLTAAQALPGVTRVDEAAVPPAELSRAIVDAARGNRTLSALMLTTAAAESGLRARIAADNCRAEECDHGRAVGLWQSHGLDHGASLTEQARDAAQRLRAATARCHGLPFPLAAMRAYGSGVDCESPIPRETERVELFRRIDGAL